MTTQSLRFSWLRSLTVPALGLVVSAPVFAAASAPDETQRERLAQIRVPFVENCGQWDQRVAFAAKANFGTVFVTRKGQLVYSLGNGASNGWTLTETAISGKPVPLSGRTAVTRVSYFHGNDPSRWQSGLPSYEEIGLGEVWPGISLSLRARGTTVEKTFTIRPGARLEKIRLRVDGAKSLRIERDGGLVAETRNGEVRFTKPAAYQQYAGTRHPVDVAYVLHGSQYGFRIGAHDPSHPIMIDPVLQATYLGGSFDDQITSIAVHPTTEEVLVAGWTGSFDFPGTVGGAQPAGRDDAFVARLNPALTILLQATYLGGSDTDVAFSLGVHPTTGDAYVSGYTFYSFDFPGTSGAAQSTPGGYIDGFIARLNSELTTLLQSTYLGGSQGDWIEAIAVHPLSGEVLVAGSTTSFDFPGTAGGAQSSCYGQPQLGIGDGFVVRLDPALKTLLQATCLGGSSGDGVNSIAVDPVSNEILVAGTTSSRDFPHSAAGAQPTFGGGDTDGFVARLGPALTTLVQATYLGGDGRDEINGTAIHPASGEVFVAGSTGSPNLPGTARGAQPAFGGGYFDGFAARLDSTLTTLLQATYVGTSLDDWVYGMLIHPPTGDLFVVGTTESPGFPGTSGGSQPAYGGPPADGFVARFKSSLSNLVQATYLGGGDYDQPSCIGVLASTDDVLVGGYTYSLDLPGTTGGAQPRNGGSRDAFVARLTSDLKLAGPCVASSTALCLTDNRFGIQVSWSVPSQGRSGVGMAVPLTGDTGSFWFFDEDNVELVVKVLDGRGINGHYWVFYGALSNVQYTITVTDTITGAVRTYENPAGTLASFADTSAFTLTGSSVESRPSASVEAIEARSAEELYGLYAALTQATVSPKAATADPCTPGGTTLCLNLSRFQVSVDWEVPSQGRFGHGTAVPITSDTGYFWFFGGDNVELVIKVLDARGVNGHFWVFYGALSNVQYTITITDTERDAVRIYTNPSGQLASVADTAAF